MRRPLVASALSAALLGAAAVPAAAGTIPDGPGKGLVPRYIGGPATPKALAGKPVPANPYQGPVGTSSMHADAYVTFALKPDGSIDRVTMLPVSPLTDFSFDFQDLLFVPVPPASK